jgi:hypothetical protein
MERSHFLVESTWLAEHLQDHDLRIVDIRGYVRTVELLFEVIIFVFISSYIFQ